MLRLLVGLFLSVNVHGFLHAQADSNNSGHGDSSGFPLNTVDEAETGLGESNAFILDTGGDDGTPKSGHGNSAGFTLDTRAGGDTGSTIDPEETGASDSGAFILDTSDGNATQPDITSGFADSGGFTLDTYDPSPFQDTGFGDSGGFVLDTGGDDGTIKSGIADSGGFILDTRDSTLEDSNKSESGFDDSGSFVLDTEDDDNQSIVNAPPTFLSDGNLSVPENQTFVYEFNATDPDGDTLTYSILYGDDANALDLNESTGILSLLSPPDFENPDDNNTDNIYEATIQVSDGNATNILNLYLHIQDVFENTAPSDLNATNLIVNEERPVGTFVGQFIGIDDNPNAVLSYILASGTGDTHNGLFTLQSDGVLRTAAVLDYEVNASLNIRVKVRDEWNPAQILSLESIYCTCSRYQRKHAKPVSRFHSFPSKPLDSGKYSFRNGT